MNCNSEHHHDTPTGGPCIIYGMLGLGNQPLTHLMTQSGIIFCSNVLRLFINIARVIQPSL